MPLNPGAYNCVEVVNHSRVVVKEKGKQVTFLNPSQEIFHRIRVDGCLVTQGPRADWIVSKDAAGSVIVELKGRDVEHAVDQLFATINHPSCTPWLTKPTKLLIICAKFPAFDTKVARAQVAARKLGMTLKVVCRTFECQIDQM